MKKADNGVLAGTTLGLLGMGTSSTRPWREASRLNSPLVLARSSRDGTKDCWTCALERRESCRSHPSSAMVIEVQVLPSHLDPH